MELKSFDTPNKIKKERREVLEMDKIRVNINNKQKEVKIPTGLRMIVRRCCNAVLKIEEIKGDIDVSVSFVNNEEIKELNKKYRNKDCATDVLSFSTMENGKYTVDPATGATVLGDVVISIEKAQEQSEKYGHTLQREVSYLTAHSMLHLLGYDHEQGGLEKIRMREKEERVIIQLGFPGVSGYIIDERDV